MLLIPKLVLKQLYTRGSLENTAGGVKFSIKNRLADSKLLSLENIEVAGKKIAIGDITIETDDGKQMPAASLSKANPMDFPLRKGFTLHVKMDNLPDGKYSLKFAFEATPYGTLKFDVEDAISGAKDNALKIPRDNVDDYSEQAIKSRQTFLEQHTGVKLQHINRYSFDPHISKGNCEHFVGVAQVPIGLAGPLNVIGEYAQGEFIVPMATAEGTLVASYNRGMKVLNQSGGVKCTVVDDAMQRAPVFVFEDARAARSFINWVKHNEREIARHAEGTSSVAKLKYIDCYSASKFAFLRFNYFTGDAAGQNMVGRATFVACSWVLENYKDFTIKNFYLESNLATDKKASQVNVMHTRGKRVVAECTIPRDVLVQNMRVEPQQLAYHWGIANVGAILSGANNNGLHSANGITAMFIATGQDVANVSESSAGIMYVELTPEGDLYIAMTIPSLIVATYGGGTSLATQKECLELLGCYGRGKVLKFAEIVAGVVLAGEISLASAISSSDWVSSHEQYGRNR